MQTTNSELDRVRDDAPMAPPDACDYLDVTITGLARLIRMNPDFPVHRLGDGPKAHRRFYRSELDAWLRNRCTAADTDRRTA